MLLFKGGFFMAFRCDILLIKDHIVSNTIGDVIETERVSTLLKTESLADVENICKNLLASLPSDKISSLRAKYSSVNPMTWDEVRQIAASPLCTVGSHCMTHICCHKWQDSSEIRRQLDESKRAIERQLSKPCDYLAWPNGNYTAEAERLAAEAGYKMAFSTKYKTVNTSGIMSIGRIYVPYQYDRFKFSISRFGH